MAQIVHRLLYVTNFRLTKSIVYHMSQVSAMVLWHHKICNWKGWIALFVNLGMFELSIGFKLSGFNPLAVLQLVEIEATLKPLKTSIRLF